jgi:hypothetical protein
MPEKDFKPPSVEMNCSECDSSISIPAYRKLVKKYNGYPGYRDTWEKAITKGTRARIKYFHPIILCATCYDDYVSSNKGPIKELDRERDFLMDYFLLSTGIYTDIDKKYFNRAKKDRFEILRLMLSQIESSLAKEVITMLVLEWNAERFEHIYSDQESDPIDIEKILEGLE